MSAATHLAIDRRAARRKFGSSLFKGWRVPKAAPLAGSGAEPRRDVKRRLSVGFHLHVVGAVELEFGHILLHTLEQFGVVVFINGYVVHIAAGQLLGEDVEEDGVLIVCLLYTSDAADE